MNKLIIENNTDLSDIDALDLVSHMVRKGRISNDGKQYCYGIWVSNFNGTGMNYMLSSFLNKKSDRIVIYKDKDNESK